MALEKRRCIDRVGEDGLEVGIVGLGGQVSVEHAARVNNAAGNARAVPSSLLIQISSHMTSPHSIEATSSKSRIEHHFKSLYSPLFVRCMTPLFFRLDASPKMGLGHLRRCCVLARACREKGAVAHFFIRSEALDLSTQDFPADAVVHEIPWDCTPEEDAALTAALCHQNGVRAGVVDHYRVSEAAQTILNAGGLRWMQFGNRLHTHPLLGVLVHDANPGATIEDYRGRIHEHEPEFLTGPGYALVAEDFRDERARHPQPDLQGITSILLTFGGGDDRGATLAALDWLEAAGYSGRRLLLATGMNPQLPALRERAAAMPLIELHVDNWHPAPLMAQCQLALCAGGTSLHELACLGVPPVIVCIADNQYFPAQSWHEAGMAVNLGPAPEIQPETAIRHLQQLLEHPAERLAMARRCWQVQDGQGAARVAEALLRQSHQH